MKIFERLTKSKDDYKLCQHGILNDNGRLSCEGRELVLDLLFQGKEIGEIRSLILKEIKEEEKEKKNV